MKTNGTWTVQYILSNEREDVFLVTGPSTHMYEYHGRGEHTEQSILDSLPDQLAINKYMGIED